MNKEDIRRALNHHELTGAVEFHSFPSAGHPKWRVRLRGFPIKLFTTPQVEALCLGLQAGENTFKPKEDKEPLNEV